MLWHLCSLSLSLCLSVCLSLFSCINIFWSFLADGFTYLTIIVKSLSSRMLLSWVTNVCIYIAWFRCISLLLQWTLNTFHVRNKFNNGRPKFNYYWFPAIVSGPTIRSFSIIYLQMNCLWATGLVDRNFSLRSKCLRLIPTVGSM